MSYLPRVTYLEPLPLLLGVALTPCCKRPSSDTVFDSKGLEMANESTLILGAMTLAGALLGCKLLERGGVDEARSESNAVAVASASETPAAAVSAAPSASASASATAGPLEPPALFEDKLPVGLPPVDRTAVAVEFLKKAAKQEDDASKAREAKDYSKAIQLYIEALKTDPGYPEARYNLARTLILAGQVDAGVAVLDQLFRVKDCYRCEGLLLRAAQEKDFANAKGRADFKARTEGVGKRLPTIPLAAKQLLPWLHAPGLDNMPPLVDVRTHIVLQTPQGYVQLRGAGAFVEYVTADGKKNFPNGRKWGPTLGPPLGMSLECKGDCCDVDTYDPPGDRSVLRQICFKHQGNAAVALYKVKVD